MDLSPVSFGVGRPVREEMVDDIHAALDHDVKYEIPANYLKGEGDSKYALMSGVLLYYIFLF